MTVRLSNGSARGIHAARFGAELTKAMLARRVSNLRLAEAAGCAKSAIANWKIGGNVPRTDTAARLADVLDWPKLVELARAGRSRPCDRCGRDAVSRVVLKEALAAYRRSDAKRVARIDKLDGQVAGLQAAVAAMCAGCEPQGLCNDAACALRPVSPLPMASWRETSEIREPEGPWGPNNRDRHIAAIRDGNARRWARPGERERQAAVNRAWREEIGPADFAARVSAGRRRQLEERAS